MGAVAGALAAIHEQPDDVVLQMNPVEHDVGGARDAERFD